MCTVCHKCICMKKQGRVSSTDTRMEQPLSSKNIVKIGLKEAVAEELKNVERKRELQEVKELLEGTVTGFRYYYTMQDSTQEDLSGG